MSKIELSKWQNPEDGFPSDQYFDAVVVALEEAGIGVHDSWRNEAWEFALILDREAWKDWRHNVRPHDVMVGWSVDEMSEPLDPQEAKAVEENEYGYASAGQCAAGWWWMPCKTDGTGIYVKPLEDHEVPVQINPLAEPCEVAAAVAALVRPEVQDHDATKGS